MNQTFGNVIINVKADYEKEKSIVFGYFHVFFSRFV